MIQVIDRVDIGNGVQLEFVHRGGGAYVPIVCVHGVTDSWRSFEPVLAALSPDIEAFALSQRGHGESDRPEAGYEIENLARDVAGFIRAQGIARAVIVGHSMGSIVAQQVAIDFPELVSGLILLGSFSDLAGNADVHTFYEEAIQPLGDAVDPDMARAFQESTLAIPIDPLVLNTMIEECLKTPARVWKAAFEGFIDVNLLPELANVSAPALILWGSSDNFGLRAEQDAIAAALPTSKLVVYPGHGHALHWESPLLIAAAIEEFVTQLQS